MKDLFVLCTLYYYYYYYYYHYYILLHWFLNCRKCEMHVLPMSAFDGMLSEFCVTQASSNKTKFSPLTNVV